MAMKNDSELFTQTDQQISVLKDRIARQLETIKLARLRGQSSTPMLETAPRALEGTLRAFEQRRRRLFERLEAKQHWKRSGDQAI
jgi:hypothetical protein